MSEFVLCEWMDQNRDILEWLVVSPLPGEYSGAELTQFRKTRRATHEKMVQKLKKMESELKRLEKAHIEDIGKLSRKPLAKVGKRVFADQRMNTRLRVLAFAEREKERAKLEVINWKLNNTLLKLKRVRGYLSLFESRSVPHHTVMTISHDFFILQDKVPSQLVWTVQSLTSFVNECAREIESFEKPLWLTNFSLFFDGMVETALQRIHEDLNYTLPLKEETELSIKVFHGPDAKIARAIDRVVQMAVDGKDARFVDETMSLAFRAIPDHDQRSPIEQSVSLMFFYRIILDRLYERKPEVLISGKYKEEQDMMMELSREPLLRFNFPIQCQGPDDAGLSVREFFQKEQFFRGSSLFLNELMFLTNPVDALYFVHKSLLSIQKAALLKELHLANEEATPDHLKKLLSFDDLFAFLVGAVLGSDIPDFFVFAEFAEKYAPQDCMCNSFEYAQTALCALGLHFRQLMC